MKFRWHFFFGLAAGLGISPAYELHEWGTFTTMSGSDGVLLAGLQREEEPLPRFVHSHFGFENGQEPDREKLFRMYQEHGLLWPATPSSGKGLGRRPVSGVTVKMETPVIYFHSDEGFHAKVKVGFNGGTISQWYPRRSAGEILTEPPPAENPEASPTPQGEWLIDFSKNHQGSIEWDVDVLSPEETAKTLLFKPQDTVNWLRARVPGSNAVRTNGGETEGYLFYRGMGNFEPGLLTTVTGDETLHLRNNAEAELPYLMVFERLDRSVFWQDLGNGVKAGESVDISWASLKFETDEFPALMYQSMKGGLTKAGLTAAEADAMIQTWWTSYFEKEGLRVFWVLPMAVTDRILPLEVKPEPAKTVRVLVGRSEVLRPRDEALWVKYSRMAGDGAFMWKRLTEEDRFGLAIQERVAAIVKSGPTAAK